MLTAIIIIALAFAWLTYETDYWRVRLPVGNYLPDFPDRWFKIFNMGECTIENCFDKRESEPDYNSDFSPRPMLGYVIYESLNNRIPRNNGDHYIIGVSPNLDGVLCGRNWLDQNWNNLADYQPQVSMNIGGVKYDMTIRQPAIIKTIMQVNKLSRTERKALKTAVFQS